MSDVPLRLIGQATLCPADTRDSAAPTKRLAAAALVAPGGMTRWARLDRYGQALCAAVSQSIATLPAAPSKTTAVYAVSAYSCFETNTAFHRGLVDKGPRLASPLLFPYTLPGAAAAEVAMHFHLGGEHVVFAGGPATALVALLSARDYLYERPGETAMVASADVLGAACMQARADDDGTLTVPLSEAAVALCLQQTSQPMGHHVTIEGAVGAAGGDADSWYTLASHALARSHNTHAELARIYSATVSAATRHHEIEAAQRLSPQIEVQPLCLAFGDAGASLGLLAAQAALTQAGTTLVFAADRSGAVALVIDHETSSRV